MDRKYPDNNCVCETDEQWAGRNFLRQAFETAGKPREKVQHGMNADRTPNMLAKYDHDTQLYWMIESPTTHRRQYFSPEAAEFAARPVRAFLEANGIEVTAEGPIRSQADFWKDNKDLVSVYSNGGWLSSYAETNDPATVAMLPHMERKIWNLVRYHDDAYRF